MQPDSNRKLYRFSGPTEYALQNLRNGVIFCQHYSAYNDPFEFWSNIYEGIPDPKIELTFPRRTGPLRTGIFHL